MPIKIAIHRFAIVFVLSVLPAAAPGNAQSTRERPDLQKYFDAAGTAGTIVVRLLGGGDTIIVNPSRAATGYAPASTFKILNSVMALDAGIVSDVDRDVFPYGGRPYLVDGKPFLPEACNTDVTLRTAFRSSCIPVYQEIARRIGLPRYRQTIKALAYGNGALDKAPADAFWLEGDYEVTALEQIAFLQRLASGNLPFSKSSLATVRDMMELERTPTYVLRGKTGYLFSTRPAIGWFVGWIERNQEIHLFALNLDIAKPEHARARSTIVRQVLQAVGAL